MTAYPLEMNCNPAEIGFEVELLVQTHSANDAQCKIDSYACIHSLFCARSATFIAFNASKFFNEQIICLHSLAGFRVRLPVFISFIHRRRKNSAIFLYV